MKKIFLGIISILFIGQIAWAQPVSDMAVIPMGITIQSVMRLTITKGGNIEFVFKSAKDLATGIDHGNAYNTEGIITASRNWDLILAPDEPNFAGEDGTDNLDFNVVEYTSSCTVMSGGASTPHGHTTAITTDKALTAGDNSILVNDGSGDNYGTGLNFDIKWRCGVTHKIGGGHKAQRYSANLILTLKAH